MKPFSEVLDMVEERHRELEPFDRFASLQRFEYRPVKTDDGERFKLIPFVGNGEANMLPELLLSEHAHRQLVEKIDIPYSFLQKCPPNLKYHNVNYFIQHGSFEKEVLLRVVRDHIVRAILSERYTPFDDLELFRLLASHLDGAQVVWEQRTDLSTHVRVIWHNQSVEIQPGDIVQRGLHISNSEVGLRSVTILGMVYRLKCRNGLLARERVAGIRHIGNPDRIADHIRALIAETQYDTETLVAKYRQSFQQRLDDPIQVIESLAKQEKLTQEEFKRVLDAYAQEPNPSMFGVVNALTCAAQAYSEAEKRYGLERLASMALYRGPEAGLEGSHD